MRDRIAFLQVRRRLRTAVNKSCSTPDELLVRAIAGAFLDSEHGLQDCATGYLLPPVSYSVVAWYIRQDTDLAFTDDFDNEYANEEDIADEQDLHHDHAALAKVFPQEEGNSMPDLTSLLEQGECAHFFKILRSPNSSLQVPAKSQPYVTADLHALIHGYQLQRVQDVLPRVHALSLHPEDSAYAAEYDRLTTPSKPKR